MNGKQIRIFAAWMAALLFALSLGAAETSGLTVEELQAVNAVERIGGAPWTPIDLASFLCQ